MSVISVISKAVQDPAEQPRINLIGYTSRTAPCFFDAVALRSPADDVAICFAAEEHHVVIGEDKAEAEITLSCTPLSVIAPPAAAPDGPA